MGSSNTFPAAKPRDSKTLITPSATTSAQTPVPGAHRNSRGHLSTGKQDVPDTAITTNAPRPGALVRQNSVQTRYMDMLLAMDTIPRLHNVLSSFFTWILLAGFIIFPGTYTTITKLNNDAQIQGNHTASTILASVKNIPLLVIAGVCTGIGAAGMVWLWWRWRQNYIWLLNKIFLFVPSTLHSTSGNTLCSQNPVTDPAASTPSPASSQHSSAFTPNRAAPGPSPLKSLPLSPAPAWLSPACSSACTTFGCWGR